MKALKLRFKESWQSQVNTSSKLEFYRHSKRTFCKENYLDSVKNYTDRVSLTRLRISAHRLEIELGRRQKTPRPKRSCKWCSTNSNTTDIENEFHLLNICGLNGNIRNDFHHKIKGILSAQTDIDPSHLENMGYINSPVLTMTYEKFCHPKPRTTSLERWLASVLRASDIAKIFRLLKSAYINYCQISCQALPRALLMLYPTLLGYILLSNTTPNYSLP